MIPIIEANYESLTNSEKLVADFFLDNDENHELSSTIIADKLHVSESTITRFSKKCGYSGFREFIYNYKKTLSESPKIHTEITNSVLADYNEILNKTYSLIDESQVERVINYINEAENIFFYGIGSSGLVAQEMKSRFMRIGLFCDSFTDADLIQMNSVLLDENCLIIILSISGNTYAVTSAIKEARKKNAKIVLFTANRKESLEKLCDELVSIATSRNLSFWNKISPQLPLLVMLDIYYAYFSNTDSDGTKKIFSTTLSAIDKKNW